MKCLLVLLFWLVWHKGSASFLDEDCALIRSSDVDFRVSRGHRAKLGDTPWMAIVSNQNDFLCGGTLITEKFVLTAAHCLDGQSQLFVKLGVYDRSCATQSCRGVENYNITRVIIHPDFNPNQNTNDIGLLELDAKVQYKDDIRPICIVTDDTINVKNISVFSAFGWGQTQTGQASQLLMAVTLFRRVSAECHYGFLLPINENQICAGSTMGDTCRGDSGGPLATVVGERYIQVGIVSYGTRMCNASGIYTDVSSYKDWIVSSTGKDTWANAIKTSMYSFVSSVLYNATCYWNYC